MAIRSEARLQQSLDEVTRLLDKHRVLETLAHRQEGPKRDLLESLQHRQNLAELSKRVRAMHGADLAFVLEALPPDDRRLVWEQASSEQAGRALVEVSGVVREWLVEFTRRSRNCAGWGSCLPRPTASSSWTRGTCSGARF